MANNRENWGSKLGVILAVAGSAVGLGNFLRFPVQAATAGGGAFIIPYLIAFVFLGIPLAWIEWTLGRYAGYHNYGTSPSTYHVIFQKKKKWAKYLGSLGLLPPIFIIFYYGFIQSWILAFAFYSATGTLMEVVAQGPDLENVDNIAEEIKQINLRHMEEGKVVVACGTARYEGDRNVAAVFERADERMYVNKNWLKKQGDK